MEENSKTKSGISRFKRIIAGILALLTAASTVLYTQTSIVLNSEALNERTQLLAAAQLLQTNEYAEMSRLGRISAYMKYYLSLAKSYEEYELGASMAVAQGKLKMPRPVSQRQLKPARKIKIFVQSFITGWRIFRFLWKMNPLQWAG